jgi:hypothetical protein
MQIGAPVLRGAVELVHPHQLGLQSATEDAGAGAGPEPRERAAAQGPVDVD